MTSFRWLFVLALAAGVAFAQPIQVNIPFAFGVDNRTYEPGDYVVNLELGNKSLRFISQETSTAFVVLGNLDYHHFRTDRNTTYYLTFHKYGERHFLHSVVRPDATNTVLMSRSERELVTSRMVAERRPVTVVIAAKVR